MTPEEMLEQLYEQGLVLLTAADRAGPDAPVPDCPGWRVRDLLRHVGTIHRWVVAVTGAGGAPVDMLSFDAAVTVPDDADLMSWTRTGLDALVTALAALTDDERVWPLLPHPRPRLFWTRRQLYETAVHRVDAELATGGVPTSLAVPTACDGVDELVSVLVPLPGSALRSPVPATLALLPTDADDGWTVSVSDTVPRVVRGRTRADCSVSGPANALFAWAWNRTAPDVELAGDRALALLWRKAVQIRR